MNYRKAYKQRYRIDFGSDYDIHHIDMNRENNNIQNLILLPKELHQRLHRSIINAAMKGKDVFKYECCANQLVCGMLATQLQEAAKIYEELQYWASCKEMEELSLSLPMKSIKAFNYNQFRK